MNSEATYTLLFGDVRDQLALLPNNSVDSVVCDPPYEIGFMGKSWDATGIAYDVKMWADAMRVLKPGGYLLSFGGSRTYHRMASAIEDAGFEIRDQIQWLYGSGFPKSMDVAKAIDKSLKVEREVLGHKDVGPDIRSNNFHQDGGERMVAAITEATSAEAKQWDGWGTALKPAHEPIVVARKPLEGTVAANIMKYGTGAINIDASRVPGEPVPINKLEKWSGFGEEKCPEYTATVNNDGRFPANLIHDGSDEVMDEFAKAGVSKSTSGAKQTPKKGTTAYGDFVGTDAIVGHNDSGTPARFFYSAKVGKSERSGSDHPTMKPLALMRYLVKMVTQPGGTVLDPFVGSGSTGVAAVEQGFKFIGIDNVEHHIDIARTRLEAAVA